MAKRDEVFPSRFLKAADLNGDPLTLTIANADYETLKGYKGKDEEKLVVSFRKFKKQLVLNLTNFDAIVAATGKDNSDDWPGHKIEVYPSEAQVGAEMKPCVRVRGPEQGELTPKAAAAKTAKKPPAKADSDDDMDDEIPY